MKKKLYIRITCIMFILGIMIAVQYNTVQHPKERDTRDIWAIREELVEEKERHSALLEEIRSLNEVIEKYEANQLQSPKTILQETVDDLKKQAGLTNIIGPGLVVRVEPATESVALGIPIEEISPDLLNQLINDIFMYNGVHIEIDGNRIVQTSAIRAINGQTTVNSRGLHKPPFNIYVGTSTFNHAQKLYNYLLASSLNDSFYLENCKLVIDEPIKRLSISAYNGKLMNNYLIEDKGD